MRMPEKFFFFIEREKVSKTKCLDYNHITSPHTIISWVPKQESVYSLPS